VKREWYIFLDNSKQGPFNIKELKKNRRVNPDTLVWKEGFKDWVPIRSIKELREVFEDENKPQEKAKIDPLSPDILDEEVTLTMQQDPFQFLLWILILILSLIYVLYLLKQ
jgi:hypothetical protein